MPRNSFWARTINFPKDCCEASNTVLVTKASDFPAAVGGVITLVSGRSYSVRGRVDVGSNRIVIPDDTTTLYGELPQRDQVVSTPTGLGFFVQSNNGARVQSITLQNLAANSEVIDLNGSAGQIVSLKGVVLDSGGNGGAGRITGGGADSVEVDGVQIANVVDPGTGVLRLVGTATDVRVSGVEAGPTFTGAGTLIVADATANWTTGRVQESKFTVAAGQTALSFAAAGTYGRVLLDGNAFQGAGTYVANYTTVQADTRFQARTGARVEDNANAAVRLNALNAALVGTVDINVARFAAAFINIGDVTPSDWITLSTTAGNGSILTVLVPGVYTVNAIVPFVGAGDAYSRISWNEGIFNANLATIDLGYINNAPAGALSSITLSGALRCRQSDIDGGTNLLRLMIGTQAGAAPTDPPLNAATVALIVRRIANIS